MNMLIGALLYMILALVLSAAWVFVLFKTGQSRKQKLLFWVLVYVPVALSILWSLLTTPEMFIAFGAWSFLVLIAFVGERLAWGFTLKVAAGEDELVWFYIIYWVPLFGWFLYRVTKLR